MKSLKECFEEGRQMLREGRAQNIRQSPHHHKNERICWQAGLLVALEELNAEKKEEEKIAAEAPKPIKHVGPPPEEKPKKTKKKSSKE